MNARLWPALLVALVLGLVVACTGEDIPGEPTPEAVPSPVPEVGIPHGFVEPILTAAEERTGYPRAQFIIHLAQEAVWDDDTLGCPREGEVPQEGLVEGYVVVLRLEGVDPAATEFLLDYRIRADDGSFILCDETAVPTQP